MLVAAPTGGKMMNKKRLLILGGPVFQIPIIKKAKEMGLVVGVVDINEDAPAASFADIFYCGSIKDIEQCEKICQDFKPDGIMSGACDTSVVTVAKLCEKLNLPGNSVETAFLSTDKLKMIERFAACKVEHPEFRIIRKKDIESNNLPNWGIFPAICKPVDSSGSRGIYFLENKEAYENYVKESSRYSTNGDVLVEEYMDGPEVSVEVVVSDGKVHVLQITDKITSGAPNFFETGHSQPSVLSTDIKTKIAELASRAVLALGINNSPAHVEIKITSDGPKMVELGARMGGDTITTHLIDTSVIGVNMSELSIKLAIGEKVDVTGYSNSNYCCAVRFILAHQGVLEKIPDVKELCNDESVVNITFMGKPGTKFSDTNDNASRIGFVVARGKTTQSALEKCQEIIKKIKISYVD